MYSGKSLGGLSKRLPTRLLITTGGKKTEAAALTPIFTPQHGGNADNNDTHAHAHTPIHMFLSFHP